MTGTDLLLNLFQRHLPDPAEAIARLQAGIECLDLPFDPLGRIREMAYPPQPGLPEGLPPFVYYFVPGSGQGSERPLPTDPVNLSYLKGGDGIGLNLGCPLRLLRVIDALSQLSDVDAAPSVAMLRDPRNHLAAVEETLWTIGWRANRIARGVQFASQSGDVDWRIEAGGIVVHLEAKFRRSDWARLVDYDTYFKAGDGFLSNALHKFPVNATAGELHIVGITTFDDVSEHLLEAVSAELLAAPQIHAVVIRSMLQMTHLLSCDAAVIQTLKSSLAVPDARTLPPHYPVIFHIEQRDERRRLRQTLPTSAGPQVVHEWFAPDHVQTIALPEPAMYRMALGHRSVDGEPTFTMIPKYLWK